MGSQKMKVEGYNSAGLARIEPGNLTFKQLEISWKPLALSRSVFAFVDSTHSWSKSLAG